MQYYVSVSLPLFVSRCLTWLGGTLQNFWFSCNTNSPNPDPISDQNKPFSVFSITAVFTPIGLVGYKGA